MKAMAFRISIAFVLAAWAAGASGGPVGEGTTRAQAVAELGAPTGTIVMGAREVLYYDRGTVELRDGKVVRANLMSPEEARRRREAEARAYQEWLRVEAERSARRKVEGERELKRMLNDASFLLEDPELQVERWQDFIRKYPEVPVGAYLQDAQRQAEEVRERRETAARLANLEQRTAEAEARAQAAEDEAARLRSQTTRYSYDLGWFSPYGYYPPAYYVPTYRRPSAPIGVPARDATGGLLPGANEFRRSTAPRPATPPDRHHPDTRHDGAY